MPTRGLYYGNAEMDYADFASYYGLPLLSLKAAVHQRMVAGR
jgi:hypothetical protein